MTRFALPALALGLAVLCAPSASAARLSTELQQLELLFDTPGREGSRLSIPSAGTLREEGEPAPGIGKCRAAAVDALPAAEKDRAGRPVPGRAAGEKQSSLQIAMGLCPMITMLRDIRTGQDFIDIYGACVRSAKGLGITGLRQDPERTLGIIAYTEAGKAALSDMGGVVRIYAQAGPLRIRVTAYPDQKASKKQ